MVLLQKRKFASLETTGWVRIEEARDDPSDTQVVFCLVERVWEVARVG